MTTDLYKWLTPPSIYDTMVWFYEVDQIKNDSKPCYSINPNPTPN